MIPSWMKKPGALKAGRIAGYVLFGTLVFAVSLVLTFPTSRLRSFIESKASQAGYEVRIDDLSIRGVSSLALFGVEVEFPPEVRTERDGTVVQIPRTVSFDRLDLSLGLFSLLFGDLSLSVTVESGDGVLGPVKVVREGDRLKMEVDEIKDFPIPTTFPAFGVRFTGTVSGKGRLDYDLKGGITTSTARVDLKGKDLVALKPTLRSDRNGDVTLTDVYLGDLHLKFILDKRSHCPGLSMGRRGKLKNRNDPTVLHLEMAEIDGKDVKVVSEGHSLVRLFPGRGLLDGQLNVEVAFSLSDAFFDREITSGGETEKPNRFLKTLLSMDPRWKRASSAGYWGVICTGSVRRPNCIPKRPVIRGGDFKVPAKAKEKPQGKPENRPKSAPAFGTKTDNRPTRTVRQAPQRAPQAPAARARVTPTHRFQPRPPSAEEEEAAVQAARAAAQAARAAKMKPAPAIDSPPRAVVPTIIGRSRLRQIRKMRAIKNVEDDEEGALDETLKAGKPGDGGDEEEEE
ncbi:MAG: type II secretion system protein GspN [Deltaproteobacteria bacterium]|nr:type II secretion system protein GspN [Deltaproteobacteria bacterium]